MVLTDAGFGYGVIGADAEAFSDGVPVYRLAQWRPAVPPEAAWLRELPSRMLNARFAVVGFHGRADELAELARWRQDSPRLAARWLHAPGGAGKTRLAARVADDFAAEGWKVVTAVAGAGSVLPPLPSQDMLLDGVPGVLVIVDYADRWPYSHLRRLFRNTLLHQYGVPARVLLLGRTTDGLAALADLAPDGVTSAALRPLPYAEGGRGLMFAAARDSFAAQYGVDVSGVVGPPGDLAEPHLGLTLAVHMAALVAVDAHVAGRPTPRGPAGLTLYLLDRERLQWANRPGGHGTSRAVLNRAVYAAALTGPLTRPRGIALLERLRVPADPDRVLTDHAHFYPAADGDVLEPLSPDRLAEDFLALTLPGHPADYPAQPWATAAATTVLEPTVGRIPRAITFLAAAAARWPHIGPGFLYPLLRRSPGLAVTAGSAALSALASIKDVDLGVLAAVEAELPTGRDVDLDAGIAAVVGTLTRHRLATTTGPAGRATLHLTHARRLANAGLHRRALRPSRRAARLYEQLVRAGAGAHRRDYAAALAGLAIRLAAVGRREKALAAAGRAAELYRELPGDKPALAAVSNTAGVLLAELGRGGEALARTREAVRIWRDCADRPGLATALSNLSARLWEAGELGQALTAGREAAAIRRQLTDDPAGLAGSLTNLGVMLISSGNPRAALAPFDEAAALYRRLARINPGAFLAGRATVLNNLGVLLARLGRHDDALAPSREAVEAWRQLAEADPAAHLPGLVPPLDNLGILLSELDQPGPALDAAQEATAIARRLATAEPAAHGAQLALSLTNLGIRLLACDRVEDAVPPARESVDRYRRLVPADPAGLARALHNLAVVLSEGPGAGAAPMAEAVALRRQLVAADRAAHLPDLATSLTAFGEILSEQDRTADALSRLDEAADLYRELAGADPDLYRDDLALVLEMRADLTPPPGPPRRPAR